MNGSVFFLEILKFDFSRLFSVVEGEDCVVVVRKLKHQSSAAPNDRNISAR